MLVVETIGRIRREHFVQGKSIKEIARNLRLSRNTVRKVLRSDETSFSYERRVQPRPKLGRWKEQLDRLLPDLVLDLALLPARRWRASDGLDEMMRAHLQEAAIARRTIRSAGQNQNPRDDQEAATT
jgi:AraC-like DNA-binding protein